jgi:hypothetical protein
MNTGKINAFRVNGSVDVSLNFGALNAISSDPLGYSCLRADGTIYNFNTGCWEPLNPSTGVPTTNQYRALSSFSANGPLSNQRYARIPDAVFSFCGIWFAVYKLNSDGSIAAQVDDYSCFPEYMSIQ